MLKIKHSFLSLIRQYFIDRHLTSLFMAMILLAIVTTIYISINLRPSELQLVSRYSSFGDTNFYRDQWYYLVSFVLFSWIVAISSIAISKKIFDLSGRPLALLFAWMGVIIIILGLITSSSVLNIWSPL